tara:strand:+ start:267 stop:713 length:447 start_codon:yes stop_codon:yes gene_type:complete
MSLPHPDTADASHPWWQPLGFRVWTLRATHNGETIEYAETCKNNHIKLQRFKQRLAERGLTLSASQVLDVKKKLSIDFVVADQSPDDLRRMCAHCGVETDIQAVIKYDEESLHKFGEGLGLDFPELEDVLERHGGGAYVRRGIAVVGV